MKSIRKILLCLVLAMGAATTVTAQVSDQQVVGMVNRMQSQGMTAQQIAVQLAARGVSEAQLQRVKAQMEGMISTGGNAQNEDVGRLREAVADRTDADADHQAAAAASSVREQHTRQRQNQIFGHEIFNNDQLTFEPNLNIATPENYVLGSGDEVIIDIWGNSQQTVRQTISPEGTIMANPVGLIRLGGLSVAQANARLQQAFGGVYSLGEGTFLNLSLGKIRSIQVHVMGEAQTPGTYTVPSLATLFHVLYNAGGVNEIGSMRDIRVNRGGKEVARVDIYDYLLHGRSDLDIALKDGDVVVVRTYTNLVAITGKVKRPMRYELKSGETLGTLIDYAGDFTGDAYSAAVRVTRRSGRDFKVFNVEEAGYKEFLLTDCDSVSVDAVLERYENRVEVRGAVFRPGEYALGGDVSTVRELVTKAEGLRGDVFAGRAVIYRKKEDYTLEALAIDLPAIMNGKAADVVLRKDDVVEVPSIFDLTENYSVSITGPVGMPGAYPWADNMTLEDLVVRAGGMLESASMARVDVVQRIKAVNSTDETNLRGIHLSFALKDGLVVEGDKSYILKPFDAVYVRTSPGYSAQQNIEIWGQVMYGGQYAKTTSDERLSALVQKAGGLTHEAYVQGARLVRRKTGDEIAREESALGLTARSGGGDSLTVEALNIRDNYSVAIELEKALKFPGSDFDLILREGDRLFVPEYQNTVTIAGAVIYPNTVPYNGVQRSPRRYVAQAGGFASRARKSKTYVIHMNGRVEESRTFRKPKVTPGAMVVVPLKGAPRNPVSAAEIMSMGVSMSSMAAMVMSIMNLSK